MIFLVFLICQVLFLTVLSAPVQESSTVSLQTKLTEPTLSIKRTNQPKARQLILTPTYLTPIRQEQELVNDEEEEINDLTEIIHENDEILQPADNIIFRPLFSYRKQQEKRRRYFKDREANRKASVEENKIRRRSSFSSYSPAEVPYYPYTVPFYYYNGVYYYPNY